MNAVIPAFVPLYGADGSLEKHLSPKAIEERLELGLITVVRKRTGEITRAYRKHPDGASAILPTAHVGTKYSYRESLPDGHRCFDLKRLDGKRSGLNYAPEHLRPIFLTVLTECLVLQEPAP